LGTEISAEKRNVGTAQNDCGANHNRTRIAYSGACAGRNVAPRGGSRPFAIAALWVPGIAWAQRCTPRVGRTTDMKLALVDHLVCPIDGLPLKLAVAEMEGEEVKTGTLRSAAGRQYHVRNFIPRFVEDDDYAASFSRQREHVLRHFETYRRNFDERAAAELFVQSTGFDLSRLTGWTLDAGCGYGRFLRVVDRAGGDVIGVDLSAQTVDLAFDFTGRSKHVHIVQADLTKLPFAKNYFCRAFSIGVLHHTPDTRASFERLSRYLAGGGEIAIWVYAPDKKVSSNAWRKVTTKLPLGVVYSWCIANESLFAWLRSLPRGGGRFAAIVPGGSLGTPFWLRVMSDFDDLTPRYAQVHTASEVRAWFEASGFTEVEILPRPTAVRGRKPACRPLELPDRDALGTAAAEALGPAVHATKNT
jgi:SAM-dependent methyltransferase